MFPFTQIISIDNLSKTAVYKQIAYAVINAIRNGVLKPGTHLSSSRILAQTLQVYRKTIIAAYNELEEQEWISIFPRWYVMVAENLPILKPQKWNKKDEKRYQAKNCQGCPLNGGCHNAKGNRIIEGKFALNRLRNRASELLNTEQGIKQRKQRFHHVETVFGNIKQNHGFRRFMLCGKEKVAIEWGLLAIAQNIRKRAA